MLITVIGNEQNLLECRQKFGSTHAWLRLDGGDTRPTANKGADFVFDFNTDRQHPFATDYPNASTAIFLDTSRTTLQDRKSAIKVIGNAPVFGFAGMPGFLNREILEVTLSDQDEMSKLKEAGELLGTAWQVVKDSVGMATPRVICMIINEAYFALEDKTATREDIDLAMKLGTNYPFGPFTWCEQIGPGNVVALLEALYAASGDARYTICPSLKNTVIKEQ